MTTSIYALIDPRTQECRYVGKAVNPAARYRKHISAALKYPARTKKVSWLLNLDRSGLRPDMIVLEGSVADWVEAEQFWIEYLRSLGARLTNMSGGGEGTTGVKLTQAQRSAISAAAKLRTGVLNPMYGRKHSPETTAKIAARAEGRVVPAEHRAKIGEGVKRAFTRPETQAKLKAARAKPISEETRAKISAAGKGRVKSEETCAKLSAALKGKPKSAEHVAKIKLMNLGRKHSDETRAKQSTARKGKPKSPEHVQNQAAASRLRWEKWREERGLEPSRKTLARWKRNNLNKLLDTKSHHLYKELNTEIEEEAMTAPSNEAIITEYLATRERIRAIRAKADELVAQQETFQANRETYLLQQDDPALVDFMTDLFLNGRDGKATAESKKKDLGLKQAEIEKWLLKVLDKLKLTGIKTLHGTVYPTRKESVSVEDWDAFLEAEILRPAAEELDSRLKTGDVGAGDVDALISLLKSFAHLEFINKGVNKTCVLERMGDKDEKNDSRPNPPPAGIKYAAIRTVGVRKS